MRKTLLHCFATALIALASVQPVTALDDAMKPMAIPAQPSAIPLETGALPGAAVKESWHSQFGSSFARNVTEATLTPFLPDPAKATGAAVIVAPGGGFRTLSMQNEGWDVAKALAARGIAAFVLKYRLQQTPASLEEFARPAPPRPRTNFSDRVAALGPQIADANAAFALVRARAGQWKIDPKRIGMVGFSAGAMLTMATTLGGGDARPAFIGDIYGPLDAVTVPAEAPPLFVALAADDPLFAGRGMGLVDSWMAAKKPIEFHLYGQGGHGFGMYPKETTSTGWFDAFYKWLVMNGLTKRAA
ncbi:MAG TPA: alpha/beta hydrolase [Polyangiaceae bacterium]|nr:alpha/beta hydrolase [Polyangiaceae bacterium]